MKIVVIGGTGLIGSKVVDRLRQLGHEVFAASPSSGVNAVTGEGLDAAMSGVHTVIDLANSPSFEDRAVLDFFEKSGRNLFAAERTTGVQHHVALSVVGTDRPAFSASGYIRAKMAQEALVRAGGVPYTIVRSTQFFEFLNGIADEGAGDREVHLSTGLMQPIASDDVADAVSDYARGTPRNDVVEIAGPDKAPLAEWVRRFLAIIGDPRHVIADPAALYFGARLEPDTLLPTDPARIGVLDFHDWLSRSPFADRLATAEGPATARAVSR
ncbi:NmrA family transcriptional regulator [Rhodanobacter sp. Root179]|uniref:SDR family oxidoreductase n=1 Tax=unclassified Rhodanobacter TaxID=2621553 RepID=UPI0006F4339C|nr:MULTISPECIES: SDR family oxidoreductase [unclassified Rhodanobacter]KQZ74608.1 NmrA family transcriptional regulator [Rhodanobacter sp. Root561]KRB33798.1 NmrA family transcriptional regulator [Rhodanobacter sp. Root179]